MHNYETPDWGNNAWRSNKLNAIMFCLRNTARKTVYARYGNQAQSRRSFALSKSWKNKLNIAFFGSDEFSIKSFKSLIDLQCNNAELISNVDLIARPAKLSGRGLSTLVDVPIVQVAEQLGINIIRAETKQEINELQQNQYDIAIAVSYGKLIPADFIKNLKYCGLNVHPSLLPKYSGASPLQYALLNNDAKTGVTVQTLHPTKFDQGKIVLQSDEISVDEKETFNSLRDKLATVGGELLVKVLQDGLYKNVQELPVQQLKYDYSYASKVSPSMKEIRWNEYGKDQLVRRINVLGSLYSFKEISLKKKKKQQQGYRRVILYNIKAEEQGAETLTQNGEFQLGEDKQKVIIKVNDGFVSCDKFKFECFGEEDAEIFMTRLKKKAGDTPNVFTSKKDL